MIGSRPCTALRLPNPANRPVPQSTLRSVRRGQRVPSVVGTCQIGARR